ncbi:MAG: ABC transporter ATP-binding protein [Actinobacteria bacterium]|nr:ABC transporter ATP-binding protein [Actinomycetota bacterium]
MTARLTLSGHDLGKAYTIRHNQTDHVTMAQVALEKIKHPLRRPERERFWALSGLDLDLREGETLGLLGRNGAGKSTLLKLLGRITQPTSGELKLWGRVGSLLEVGTGFHPELTGRENVYLNGSILGVTTKEIARQFDAIVDFAGVEKFLDTPVKRYSSGMYVRLAFAVAAHLEAEVLLVDEVLSVGDADFQRKCVAKMREVATAGRSVVLVSHNLRNVEDLCERALVLDKGRVSFDGTPEAAITHYLEQGTQVVADSVPEERPGSGEIRVTSVWVPSQNVAVEEPKRVKFRVEHFGGEIDRCVADVIFRDSTGVPVAHCSSAYTGDWMEVAAGPVEVECSLESPWLHPGDYLIDIWLWNYQALDQYEGACQLTVRNGYPYEADAPEVLARRDVVPPKIAFSMTQA